MLSQAMDGVLPAVNVDESRRLVFCPHPSKAAQRDDKR
jgi:hypothetical protein